MKILLATLATLALFAGINCASGNKMESFTEGAATCNEICKDNPEIDEYSHKAGGGVTLLFMGGFEERCGCK